MANSNVNDYFAHFPPTPHSPHIGYFASLHHCSLMFFENLCCPHLPRILILGQYLTARHHSHSCDFISCIGTKTIKINVLMA